MAFSLEQIKKYRTRFGWVFLVSYLIALVIPFLGPGYSVGRIYRLLDPFRVPEVGSQITTLIMVVSLLTSIISLLGFVITTFFAWRKERREREHSDLDLEKKRLEVERLRQELVRGRNQDSQDG